MPARHRTCCTLRWRPCKRTPGVGGLTKNTCQVESTTASMRPGILTMQRHMLLVQSEVGIQGDPPGVKERDVVPALSLEVKYASFFRKRLSLCPRFPVRR